MKKIVALVLCLVLALSLCTVAFAANSEELDVTDGYKWMPMDNTNPQTIPEDATLTYFAESVTTKTVDGKTTKTVTPAYYLVEFASGTKMFGIVTDASAATHKLVTGDEVVAYLYANATYEAKDADTLVERAKASDTAVKVGTTTKTAECGKLYKDGAEVDVYEIDGDYYELASATDTVEETALLNGKICMFVDSTAAVAKHQFDAGAKANSTDGTYTSIYCTKCKEYVAVIKASKVPDADVSEYTAIETEGFTGYVYLTLAAPSASTSTDSTTTVESAKTFDAGIALYAGMALASVAGSAVVIGKKKEF